MLTYITTRFSIFDHNFKGFVITRNNNKDECFNKLFSSKRLNHKFKIFKKITLPSILNQTNKNYIWNIFTSEYLPEKYKNKLIKLTSPHKEINIHYVKSFKCFYRKTTSLTKNNTFKYCTIRLDDDDGLSANFIENLQKYKNEDKTIISHTKGTMVTIKDDKVVLGKKISKPNNGQGLAAIGMNIYSCGNHTKVAEKFKVIYNNTPDMYLVNCDEQNCDTKRKFVKSGKKKNPPPLGNVDAHCVNVTDSNDPQNFDSNEKHSLDIEGSRKSSTESIFPPLPPENSFIAIM